MRVLEYIAMAAIVVLTLSPFYASVFGDDAREARRQNRSACNGERERAGRV